MSYLYINGQQQTGIEMGDGFMDAIGGASPLKEYITNSSELEDGVRYCPTTPKCDERQLTLPFYISGATSSAYQTNKAAFFALLYEGNVHISVPDRLGSNTEYHLKFKNGVSYAESRSGCFSVFTAKFTEPNPTDRAPREHQSSSSSTQG